MADWSFLTKHALAMLFITRNPEARIRDIAAHLDVTDRTVHAIIRDLEESGYVIKERAGRRNRYHIRNDLPLRDAVARQAAIGDLLRLLDDAERDPS